MRRYKTSFGGVRGGNRRFFIICAILSVCAIIAFAMNRSLKPIAFKLAESYGAEAAAGIITQTVSDYFDSANIGYSDLVRLSYNSSGFVSSVEYNGAAINKMKSECLSLLRGNLKKLKAAKIKIPLGSLFNDLSLSGRGPSLNIRVSASAVPDIEILSAFDSAGVNQSKHEIRMCVSAKISVFIPPKSEEFTVKQDYVLAQTVVVGDVPDGCAIVE